MQTRALTAGLSHLSLARPIGLAEGIGDQILSAICYLPTLVTRSVRCTDGFDRAACSLVFVPAAWKAPTIMTASRTAIAAPVAKLAIPAAVEPPRLPPFGDALGFALVSYHSRWCSLAQLASTRPLHMAWKAPSMPIVPM